MAKTSYILSKLIARGGMAEIYLGKAVGENAFQRICAIKRILPHYAQDKEFIEMFRDEAHICKRLQQANIVQVYDFTEVEGSFALIMEHIDGADLRTLLSACESARVRMSVPMVVYMAACSLRGLHYAHTKIDEITNLPLGIVHRDVSPQNILISYEGEVKITDFGIADADDKIAETRPGVVKGKYSYMSPEQVSAKPLDGRSDVFAMAIVMWECLAMKRLFTGQTEVETIRKVQNCEIPYRLHDLNSDVDAILTEIVEKGLTKDRKKRYQTAASFERALLKYLNSRYPDFAPSEFGNFLKQILAKKREETQGTIKQVLTTTNLPAHRQRENSIGDIAPAKDPASQSGTSNPIQAESLGNNLALDEKVMTRVQVAGDGMRGKQGQTFGATRIAAKKPQFSPVERRRRWPGLLLSVALLGFILGGIYMWRGGVQIFDDKMHLEVKVVPEAVTLAINGQPLNKGFFARTPVKLHLKPGNYQLRISRGGYQSKTIDFQGRGGDMIQPPSVILEPKVGSSLIAIRILAKGKRLFANVDFGLAKGLTPLFVPNVEAGVTHTLTFRPEGESTKMLRCVFRPVLVRQTSVFVVTIDQNMQGNPICTGKPQ